MLKATRSECFAACVTNIIAVSAMPSMLVLRISRRLTYFATVGLWLSPVADGFGTCGDLFQVENARSRSPPQSPIPKQSRPPFKRVERIAGNCVIFRLVKPFPTEFWILLQVSHCWSQAIDVSPVHGTDCYSACNFDPLSRGIGVQ